MEMLWPSWFVMLELHLPFLFNLVNNAWAKRKEYYLFHAELRKEQGAHVSCANALFFCQAATEQPNRTALKNRPRKSQKYLLGCIESS